MTQRFRALSVLWLFLGTFAAGASYAQGNPEPGIVVSTRDADIRVIAQQVQQAIGRQVVVDPRVSARITMLSNSPLTPSQYYDLFVSALEVHGLVAIESADAIRVVPGANARNGQDL
ncbi:MAG TPA: hypothetical protein VE665_00865 [Hyphomicrobiaceae bacterium]|jgi:general secretion pathway protein D|nr:hypothetical protein [Hyphomicrobiaceae bacterium]